jgi:quercetin 2,3-dioxygenase
LLTFEQVHFIQIWAVPSTSKLTPNYYTRHFTDDEKKDKWARVVGPVGALDVNEAREASGPAPVHSPVALSATIISPGTRLTHTLPSTKNARKAYVHVIQRSGYNAGPANGASVRLSGNGDAQATLREGDGAYIMGDPESELVIENTGEEAAEVLLFDIDF